MFRVELSEDEINYLLNLVTDQRVRLSDMYSYYDRTFAKGLLSRELTIAQIEGLSEKAKLLDRIEHALCSGCYYG